MFVHTVVIGHSLHSSLTVFDHFSLTGIRDMSVKVYISQSCEL